MKHLIAVAVCLALCFVGGSWAGRCYECNYSKVKKDVYENWLFDYTKDCGDNFKKSNVTYSSCKDDCYKAVVDLPEKNTRCISRGCFPNDGCDELDANEKFLLECGGKAYQPTLHCCKGNKCNGAAGVRVCGLVMVVAMVAAFFGVRW